MALRRLLTALFVLGATGCATPRSVQVDLGSGRVKTLAGIDACDDFRTDPIVLDPSEPVTVLVHGCKSSTGRFRNLARVIREHGQQAVCFAYDDRRSLERVSARLLESLDELRTWTQDSEITVIGHSQGGLVSRRALVENRKDGLRLRDAGDVRLVTISAPFNGIRSSKHCGSIAFHVLTLGVSAAICQGIAGAKWHDIFPRADFIRHPGKLVPDVSEHLEIVTDETGTCRRKRAGKCAEDDFVFSLTEQQHPRVDNDTRVQRVQIRAGHTAVVGGGERPPTVLVEVLRDHRVLGPGEITAPAQLAALLARLY